MFRNYLKIAWWNLLRNKVYSAINMAGLSIGLASCMLILLYTKDEVSCDQFHQKKDGLLHLGLPPHSTPKIPPSPQYVPR